MIRNLLSLLLVIITLTSYSQSISEPSDTRIVIAGVLDWQDPSVSSFNNENRKDKELHNLISTYGIPDSSTTLLIDEEATLERMTRSVKRQMRLCTSESTFIFYYAGHGSKINDNYYFCNYDMGKQTNSMFDVNSLYTLAAENFKGKRIILMADCCYSGSLLAVGKKIADLGKEVIVLTSATSSNISTGNWTFTQTLLDMMRGSKLGDHNNNGIITLNECASEIKNAMKFREYQLSGYAVYGLDDQEAIVGVCPKDAVKTDRSVQPSIGSYVYAQDKNQKWRTARLVGATGDLLRCEFYNYSVYDYVDLNEHQIRDAYFPVYSVGQKVEVMWEGKYYPAEILKTDDVFMYIHYIGDDDSYDEWVMYDRVKTGHETACSIEWNGAWYPGYILKKGDQGCFVTYDGYEHTWDEWVSPERVK